MVALAVVETLLGRAAGFSRRPKRNASNGFVPTSYQMSASALAEPFQGINRGNSGNLEYASAIAMVVYAVAALPPIVGRFAITAGPGAAGDKVVTSRTGTRGERVNRRSEA